MAHNKSLFPMVLVFVYLGILAATESKNLSPCDFPEIYNFGDSNSDTASDFFITNNITRGHLIVDFIAEKLGKPYLRAYVDKIATNFSYGANFAVAGSTILLYANSRPYPYLVEERARFTKFKAQTIHLSAIERERSKLPKPEDFPKALYTIDIGQNDLYRSMDGRNIQDVPEMIRQLGDGVRNLYNEGARIFWMHNTGPIGCLPKCKNSPSSKMSKALDEYGCLISYNDVAKEFNKQLLEKVVELRAELKEASITYVDVYTAKYKLFGNAKNLGFKDPFATCNNGNIICTDTSKYLLYDEFHYTEAANRFIAEDILNGSLSNPPLPITHACYKEM